MSPEFEAVRPLFILTIGVAAVLLVLYIYIFWKLWRS